MADLSLDMFRLDGRVAVVTGAGSGLGEVFATALSVAGARVICADLDGGSAKALADRLDNARAAEVDVGDEQSVAALFDAVKAEEGQLDVLVNNAGISTRPLRIHEMPVEDWDRLDRVNNRGVFLCTRAALGLMRERGAGSVINISSVAGLVGVTSDIGAVSANYSASKGAVIGLTRQAAAEYGPEGIRFNAICPGWHLGTQLGREAAELLADPQALEGFLARVHQLTPLQRTAEPRELAGLCLFLASDASSFMTGQIIASDGGWTVW